MLIPRSTLLSRSVCLRAMRRRTPDRGTSNGSSSLASTCWTGSSSSRTWRARSSSSRETQISYSARGPTRSIAR